MDYQLWIKSFGGRRELRIDIPEGRIHEGDPGWIFEGTSVDRSSTSEDCHTGKRESLRVETPEG
jgi:hypothetical protein